MRRFFPTLSSKPSQTSRRRGKASRLQATLDEANHVFSRCIEDYVETEERNARTQDKVQELDRCLDDERRCHAQYREQAKLLKRAVGAHSEAASLRDAEIRGLNLTISVQQQRCTRFQCEVQQLREEVNSLRTALASRDEELAELKNSRVRAEHPSLSEWSAVELKSELFKTMRRSEVVLSEPPSLSPREEEGCHRQASEAKEVCNRQAIEDDTQLCRSPVRSEPAETPRQNATQPSPFSEAFLPASPFHSPCLAPLPFRKRSRRPSPVDGQSGSEQESHNRADANAVCRSFALPKRRSAKRTTAHRSSSSSTPWQEPGLAGEEARAFVDGSAHGQSFGAWLQSSSPTPSDETIEAALRTKLAPLMRDTLEDDAQSEVLPANSFIHQLTAAELHALSSNFSSCLGAGSFGQVFAGKAGFLPRFAGKVAIKVPPRLGDTNTEMQFWRELRVAELGDSSLMPVIAVCMDLHALVYPCADATLEDRLRTTSPPGPGDGLAMLLGSARGLIALHDRGFIHRDVKSPNIFVFTEGQGEGASTAKLGDFGLVWEAQVATIAGTASYLDPQAVAAGCCSQKSDVFSLGVVMLEVLLGRSVTELPPDSKALWQQLRDALPLAENGAAARVSAAVVFAVGAGASHSWNDRALEVAVKLVMEATQDTTTQVEEVDRPTATVVVERLQAAERLQLLPPPLDAASPCRNPSDRVCTICFEEQIEARFRPCCHSLACRSCAALFVHLECPMCRAAVDSFEIGQFESTFEPARATE